MVLLDISHWYGGNVFPSMVFNLNCHYYTTVQIIWLIKLNNNFKFNSENLLKQYYMSSYIIILFAYFEYKNCKTVYYFIIIIIINFCMYNVRKDITLLFSDISH